MPEQGGPQGEVVLSVLLVTYDSRRFIDACLAALRDTVSVRYEVVLADNASHDGTLEHVRRTWPAVTCLDMGANTGFATACNRALGVSTGRHVLLLNGDAVVAPEALDALVGFLDAHPRAGVAAPLLLNEDGSDQGTARSFPTPAAAVFGRRSPLTRRFPGNRWSRRYLPAGPRGADGPVEVDWVSGACLMVPRRVVEQVGALDPGYFMYWEDADWCRRIKAAGYGVWCVPAARVVHAEGGSSGGGWPVRQVLRFHRAAYRYYRIHHLQGGWVALAPLAAAALTGRGTAIVLRDAVSRREGRG